MPSALASATRFTILEELGAPGAGTGPLTLPSPRGRGAGGEGSGAQEGSAQGAGVREVPIRVTGEVPYPDGSLMFVDISFPATLAEVRSHRYWLAPAPQGRASEYQPEAGVELPVLTFVLREESGPAPPTIDMPVGQMMVRVDQHPGFYYYWYLVPMGAILALLIWRKVHLR